jgi:hypothetical protein
MKEIAVAVGNCDDIFYRLAVNSKISRQLKNCFSATGFLVKSSILSIAGFGRHR